MNEPHKTAKDRAGEALRDLQKEPSFADRTLNAKIQALAETSPFSKAEGGAYVGTHALNTSKRALFVFAASEKRLVRAELSYGENALFACVAYEYNKRLPFGLVSRHALMTRYLPTSREQAARICPAIMWDAAFSEGNSYLCYAPGDTLSRVERLHARTSFEARKMYANKHGKDVYRIVGIRLPD